jgi:hypothetical protein
MPASARALISSVGWTTAILVGLLLLVSVAFSYAPDLVIFPLGPLFLFGGLIILVFGPIAIYAAIRERQWRKILTLPVALAATALLAYPVWMAGDYFHLAGSYALYHDKFDHAPQPFSIPWSSNGFAGMSCDRYLVYDRSGHGGEGSGPGVFSRHLTSRFHIRADCR